MVSIKRIPAVQFALFRIFFGLYLCWHFLALGPYAAEVYGNTGMLPDKTLNPTFWLLPSPFWFSDGPIVVTVIVYLLAALSLAFALGYYRRPSALIIWYGSACLFNRNILTSNPSLSYVGLLLLLCAIIPTGEPSISSSDSRQWRLPSKAYWCAWWLMAIGYTFSGLIKLQSPSWYDGTAFYHLITNPLARPSMIRDAFLLQPDWVISLLTWGALAGEILFLPLSCHRLGRAIAWTVMVGMHIGILTVVDFADLTLGMLMLHLFTFDPDWLPAKLDENRRIVFFDGDCGLCQRSIQIFTDLDIQNVLLFAPLQGQTAEELLPEDLRDSDSLSTMAYVVASDDGTTTISTESDAVIRVLADIGGLSRLVSFLGLLPKSLRNSVYRYVANNRLKFSKKLSCPIPSKEELSRILP